MCHCESLSRVVAVSDQTVALTSLAGLRVSGRSRTGSLAQQAVARHTATTTQEDSLHRPRQPQLSLLTSTDGGWCCKRQGAKLPSSKLDWSLWNSQLTGADTLRSPQYTHVSLSRSWNTFPGPNENVFSSEILILLIWSNNFHTIQHMEIERRCWRRHKYFIITIQRREIAGGLWTVLLVLM